MIMAYIIKGRSGQPVVKDDKNIFGSDFVEMKLLDLDEKEGTFVARASSKKEDRDRDILHQDGFDLKNFKKNPVIPWSHNYWEPPVAKSIKTWVDTDLMFQPKFDLADEFAVKIFNKYKGGFLTSFSVGFIGLEFTPRDEKDPWWGGREFTKMELLEISCVAVPANPHANVHVNAVASEIKSLGDMGFPVQFARKKGGGLFYPIRDVNEFTGPSSICKLKGLELIYAKTLSDKHPEAAEPQLVGYSFAPDWKEADALSFVKSHSEPTRKSWLYQLDLEESKGLVITEIVQDAAPILEFTAAVDLGEKDATGISVYRVVNEKCIDEEPPAKLEDKKVADAPPPVKELAVEVKIDDLIPKFIECLNLITGEVKTLVSKVDEILIKKPIDLQNGSCDNQDNGNGQAADLPDAKTGGSDDSIEFGENLLTPEDKTSDDGSDQIEIDVAGLDEITQLTQQAGGAVAESLGKKLMEAMKQSGRID
jgi:HK97 family phage prohead protease